MVIEQYSVNSNKQDPPEDLLNSVLHRRPTVRLFPGVASVEVSEAVEPPGAAEVEARLPVPAGLGPRHRAPLARLNMSMSMSMRMSMNSGEGDVE